MKQEVEVSLDMPLRDKLLLPGWKCKPCPDATWQEQMCEWQLGPAAPWHPLLTQELSCPLLQLDWAEHTHKSPRGEGQTLTDSHDEQGFFKAEFSISFCTYL